MEFIVVIILSLNSLLFSVFLFWKGMVVQWHKHVTVPIYYMRERSAGILLSSAQFSMSWEPCNRRPTSIVQFIFGFGKFFFSILHLTVVHMKFCGWINVLKYLPTSCGILPRNVAEFWIRLELSTQSY